MPSGRKSASKEATQDDSLVVHPATQGAVHDSDDSAAGAEDSSEGSDKAEEDSQGYWEAKEILDEAKNKYLISWKGTDENGEPWEPTWEPKENANSVLVESWRTTGRLKKRQADKQRRQQAKAAKKTAKKGGRASTSHASNRSDSSAATATPRANSVEVEEPVRKNVKRKMVLSDSEASSQPATHQVKKQKPAQEPVQRKVAFDIVLDDDEESSDEAAQAVSQNEDTPAVESSGETSVSLVPDSQCLPIVLVGKHDIVEDSMSASQGVAASASSGSSRARRYPELNSPATSHSDLEAHSLEEDDDVPLFDPTCPDRRSSPEPEHTKPQRRLAPVPVPRAAASGIHHPASSQLDPIENPDSSPPRSPFREQQRQQQQHQASPQPRTSRPAKARLELGSVEDESPASSFEAEVQSSAAASYVSLPIPAISALARMPGGSPLRPFSSRPTVSAAPVAKRLPFRHPTPPAESGIAVNGNAVASVARPVAAPRAASPEIVEESQVLEDLGGAEDFVQEFIAEFLDFSSSQEPNGKAGGEAQDAGEGGYPPSGYNPYGAGAPPQGGGGGAPPPGPSHIPGYIAAPPAGAMPVGYGYPAAPGYPGGGFPPIHLPPAHSFATSPYPQAAKREHDDDNGAASKKPRTDQYGRPLPPTQSPVPMAPAPHVVPSPYPPAYYPHAAAPSPQPFQTHSQPALPPPASSPYGAHPSAHPPALNVISPSPSTSAAIPSPSLTRVQSMEPFAASPSNNRPVPASPAPAINGPARSPSPLPANAMAPAPVTPSSPAISAIGPSTSVSRNGSPAPTATKVEELIALVRASPYILETDGTKVEIEKFLRDPLAYKAVSEAPLMSSEFWAFELRRQVQQGAEKADFVVLRTKEGTYQLKRAARDKVEFATSLSHTASRMRGLTPAVETLAGSSPAPPPPPPSQMTRDQLEQEVERLRAANQVAETELVTLRPAAAEAAKLKVDVQSLQKTNKSLQNSRDAAQSDLTYVQAQYQAASSAAVERANEARLAEEETARLRVLLDTGLQQKQQLHAAKEKQLKSEVAKLRKEMAFYKEQSRRTNEREVREAAAKWAEHVAEMKIKAEDEARRARGEVVEQDVDSDDEDAPMAATAAGVEDVAAATLAAASSSPDFVTALAGGNISMGAFPSSSAPEPSTLSGVSVTTFGTQSVLPVAASDYRCEWRVGTESQAEVCGAVCPSKDALQEHVMGHVVV